ncbi:MAG: hypothetical protein K8E24_011900 [Methanobacterium paludis]|nr:hypothetical protein [Methanobacterium paludis]
MFLIEKFIWESNNKRWLDGISLKKVWINDLKKYNEAQLFDDLNPAN